MKPPPRPGVILEDLDELEQRRRRHVRAQRRARRRGEPVPPDLEGPESSAEGRRLVAYMRPYRGMLLAALVMAIAAGAFNALRLVVFERILAPILNAPQQISPAKLASLTTDFATSDSTLGYVFSGLIAHVRAGWWALDRPQQLGVASVGMVVLVLASQANRYSQRLTMRSVALSIVRDIRHDLFERLLGLSLRFFHANHSGKLVSRITNDLNSFGNLIIEVMVSVFTDLFTLVGVLALLWSYGGTTFVIGVGIVVLSLLPVHMLGKRIRAKDKANQAAMGDVYATLTEALSSQRVVKGFTAEKHEQQRFDATNESYTRGQMKSAKLRARVDPISEVVTIVGLVVLIWIGAGAVFAGETESSQFMSMLLALGMCGSSVRSIGAVTTRYQRGMASAERVATLLYSESEIVDADDAIEIEDFHDRIEFDHVTFSHGEGPVLADLTFTIRRGETVAIVGATGSGKSTIADLLLRFFDVDGGRVTLDGRDLRSISIESLRRQIAIVTQDTILFAESIAANIAYARPDKPRTAIEDAARAAHAHDFITELPNGYDTKVGERGVRLSGGERQRIAIARALLRDTPILVLDEATSALDSYSEAIVQRALGNLMQGRTALVIAHRLSTIVDADRILVLEDGKVLESGTHTELMEHGGRYARLWEIQRGGDR